MPPYMDDAVKRAIIAVVVVWNHFHAGDRESILSSNPTTVIFILKTDAFHNDAKAAF